MNSAITFFSGTLLHICMAVFVLGLFIRFVLYFLGLDWKLDRVGYKDNFGLGLKGGLHSAFKWLLPFGTRSWRSRPLFTLCFFILHIGVVLLPVFVQGHNISMKETLGFGPPPIPEGLANALALAAMLSLLLLMVRRLILPEVRILNGKSDFLLPGLVLLVLCTGYMIPAGTLSQISAQVPGAEVSQTAKCWLLCHILSGEIFLLLTPFTRLNHMVLFFASRIQLGMDFAIKRGGRQRKNGAFFPW